MEERNSRPFGAEMEEGNMFCSSCGKPNPEVARVCESCGAGLGQGQVAQDDGGVAKVIPYKNMPALFSYYLGVFSLIPCLGSILSIAAIICGIFGLKKANENPGAHGKVHAIVGLILGSIVLLLHLAVIIMMIVADVSHSRY